MAQSIDLSSSPTLVPFHLEGDLTALNLGHTPSDSLTLSQIPFIVGVAGGRASGKRSMCTALYEQIRHQPYMQSHHVLILCQDDFYRNLTDHEREFALQGRLNMDHPDAFDFDYLEQVLSAIRQGELVELPEWDPVTFTRKPGRQLEHKPDVVLLTGVLILYKRRIRNLLSLQVFVDIDSDTRLSRQVMALMAKSAGSQALAPMVRHYLSMAKPSFEEFIFPTKRWADLIVPRGRDNDVAIGMIIQHMRELFKE